MKQQRHTPPPLSAVDLKVHDPDYTGEVTKKQAREEVKALQRRMQVLQEMLYAQGKHAFNMGQRSQYVSIRNWPARLAEWLEDRGLTQAR